MQYQIIIEQIDNYLNEQDWKVWLILKEDIKKSSYLLEIKLYNELMDYVSGLKTDFSGENKLKVFELWAMLSNNKIYIEK